MEYKCRDCGKTETLWNSRDGVTPFIIGCRFCDGDSLHDVWHNDRCVPHYRPQPGMRVFVDLTPEQARQEAAAYVAAYWDSDKFECPLKEVYESKEEAIESLTAESLKHEGAPAVVTIPDSNGALEHCKRMING